MYIITVLRTNLKQILGKGDEIMGKIDRQALNLRRYEAYAHHRDAKAVTDYYISNTCGIPSSTLYDWRHGRSCPKADTLLKICKELGISLDRILVD